MEYGNLRLLKFIRGENILILRSTTGLPAVVVSCALICSLFVPTVSHAQAIPIINSGFELPSMVSVGDSSDNVLNGWLGDSAFARTFGAYYVPASAYNSTPAAPEGLQIAYVNNGTSIAQNTGVALVSNTTYTLSALVGRNNGSGNSAGQALLFQGGTIVNGEVTGGTLLGSSSPVMFGGQFSQAQIVFSTGVSVSSSGNLIIQLKSLASDQVNFDNVSLFRTSAVPEPGGFALLAGSGTIGTLLLSRKRRK